MTGYTRTVEVFPDSYFDGYRLVVPGENPGPLSRAQTAYPGPPSSAEFSSTSARFTTRNNWYVECLPSIPGGGEGFVAVSPEGHRYTFAERQEFYARDADITETVDLPVFDEVLFVTEIEDVHGNWVRYDYSNGRLDRIHANDGREITFSYNGTRIASVTANNRSWDYTYDASGRLTRVDLPDGRYWTMSASMPALDPAYVTTGLCGLPSFGDIDIRHPDGTTAQFSFEVILNGRTHVDYLPRPPGSPPRPLSSCFVGGFNAEVPSGFYSIAVTEKQLTVPGGGTYTWSRSYEQDSGSYTFGSPGSLADTKERTVTNPDGSKTVTLINRRYGPIEGQIERVETLPAGSSTPLRTVQNTYVQGNTVGSQIIPGRNAPSLASVYRVYNTQAVIEQDGSSYTTTYTFQTNEAATDFAYGEPRRVTTFSTASGGTRTIDYTYEHKLPNWVIGLLKTATFNNKLFAEYDYNPEGQSIQKKAFGSLLETYAYDSSGMLQSVTDALGRQYQLNNYKRGRPQSVLRPDMSSVSQVIDDNGWTTSITNSLGHTISYTLDSAGRVTRVNRTGSFSDVTVSYSGFGSGIVQTVNDGGRFESITTYDGLYRPILVEQRDLVGSGGSIFTRSEYDGLSRRTFTSFPSTNASASSGIDTSYDALGREIRARENVSPFATTDTDFLPNNSIRVTDPEGFLTTTKYTGYGSPDDGEPIEIVHPEGLTTTMSYDTWGFLTSVSQSGSGKSVTHDFYYDTRQRLCSRRTPETGTTAFSYNFVDELVSKADGLGGTGCTPPTGGGLVTFTRDDMGRVTLMNYADPATPDVSRSFDTEGQKLSSMRGLTNWTYAYDEMGNLTSEVLNVDSRAYSTTYTYNNSGQLSDYTSPGGRNISLSPDGFGRPTGAQWSVLSLASGAQYHPSGALAALTYGNGYGLTATFSARQIMASLKVSSGSVTALDFLYTYDDNARVTAIDDRVTSAGDRNYLYDGLGRLIDADGIWGQGGYTYDVLGNLIEKRLGTRTVDLTYDPTTNRLIRSEDPDGPSGTRILTYDSRGNVTALGAIDLAYDAASQPIEVTPLPGEVANQIPQGSEADFSRLWFGEPDSMVSSYGYTFNGTSAVFDQLETLIFRPLATRDAITAVPGVTYRLTAEIRVTGDVQYTGVGAAMFVGRLDANYDDLGALAYTTANPVPNSGWVTMTQDYVAQPDDVYLRPVVYRRPDMVGSGTFEVRSLTLVEVQDGSRSASLYTYDGNFKRVKSVEDGETIYQIYSASGALLYRDNATTGETTDYIQMGGSTLARIDSSGDIIWTFADHLGSPTVATDASGTILWREIHTPYGERVWDAPANDNHPAFTGHVRDQNTGLTYMQARYYDPVIGRFLSSDPVGFQEGGWQYVNRYWYTAGDPVNAIDPDGRQIGRLVKGLEALWNKVSGKKSVKDSVGDEIVGIGEDLTTVFTNPISLDAAGAVVDIALGTDLSSRKKGPNNPYGSKGKPDHQSQVEKEFEKALAEAGPGETVLKERKATGMDKRRIPDVQIRDETGRTRAVTEVERTPNSKRVRDKRENYRDSGIDCTVVDCKGNKVD